MENVFMSKDSFSRKWAHFPVLSGDIEKKPENILCCLTRVENH